MEGREGGRAGGRAGGREGGREGEETETRTPSPLFARPLALALSLSFARWLFPSPVTRTEAQGPTVTRIDHKVAAPALTVRVITRRRSSCMTRILNRPFITVQVSVFRVVPGGRIYW